MIACLHSRAVADVKRRLREAQKKLSKASAARFDLPGGTSRARVTTANARHSTAAQAVTRAEADLRVAEDAAANCDCRGEG